MLNKIIKLNLILLILLSTVMPSNLNYASAEKENVKEEVEEDNKEETDKEESKGDENLNNTKPELSGNIGLDAVTATTMQKEIHSLLVSLGGTGKPLVSQFTGDSKKEDNAKLFNSIVVKQLELYELLYATTIDKQIDSPVKETVLGESEEFGGLRHYLISYNIINAYIDTQVKGLEAVEGHNKDLVEALKLLKLDMTKIYSVDINPQKPLTTESIRTIIQSNIDKSTSHAISTFIKYLNEGKGSNDISNLNKADTKELTKDILNVIKQWNTLPHIKNATDSMKLMGINNINREWLTALQATIDSMETDNGGTTNSNDATKNDDTNPELATSALGRMGSSLFTVSRSKHADDNPNKPLTNTLAWTVNEGSRDDKFLKHDPGPVAKDNFLAMFAATSMYTPFISKIGDKDYIEAFKALYNNSAEQLKDDNEKIRFTNNALGPIDILNQVQNLKKPLYYFNNLDTLGKDTVYGHSIEDVKGVAELLTVGDLISTIKNKGDLAAITLNGSMEKDGDSWAFYNYSLNIDGQVETTVPEGGEVAPPDVNTKVAGTPIVNKITADKTVNGGQDNTRVIFEMTFNEKNPGAGFLTAALMHNIYNDTVLKSKFAERQREAVYIDAIGNIVLNDGLIVLPASANPTYWAIPNGLEGTDNETETWTYNPFTVAFMDTYPAIYQGGTASSSVNQKKDKNKYILSSFSNFNTGFIVTPLKKGFKSTYALSRTAGLFMDFKIEGVPKIENEIVVKLKNSIGVDDDETVAENSSFIKINDAIPLQMRNFVSAGGDSIFPYLNTKVTDTSGQESFNSEFLNYRSSILIAKNMYAYLIGEVKETNVNVTPADGKSSGGSSVGLLREGFLFNNVTMPVLTGITNGAEFDRSNAKSDLLEAGGDANIVEKWILDFSKWLSVFSAESDNILAIASSDDVSLLKLLYGIFVDYGYYIIFLLLMVMVIIFLRESDFMAAVLKCAMIAVLLFTSMFLIPLLIPGITGFTSSPLTKSTVLNSLMTKLEISEKVNSYEAAGKSGLSVKLYNLSPKQAKEINEQYSYDKGNYLTNKFSINDNLGLYIQGTEMRLDLYSFWRFDPLIIATKDNVTDPNNDLDVPQIYHSDHSTSEYMIKNPEVKNEMSYNNDLVDYYMPFNLLENGFMKTLNTYLVYYNPPQSVVKYPDGLVKSSYILNTYMKSLAFLSGEPNIAELIASSKTKEDYSHRGLNEAEVKIVNEKFYPYGDILNLQSWVDTEWNQLPSNYANALWTQAMLKSGYYSPGSGKEKRTALANRVNRKAYDMIIQMKDTKGLVSDESMIKLISLYATFEWNKEVSYLNYNVYPRTASLNEVSASDIISATVLGQSKQFIFYDTSVISNVFADKGLVGVVAIDIALLTLIAYSIILSWIMPTMILGLLIYAVYLILSNRNMMPALIFTFKLTSLAIVINLILVSFISAYTLYDNIYLLSVGLLVIDILFVWLFWKFILNPKSKIEGSWQRRHLRQIYGRNENYGGYDRHDRYARYDGYGGYRDQSSPHMQDYLRESGGINGRRSSNSNRYYE